jgi:uncharacterized caspase-like protein
MFRPVLHAALLTAGILWGSQAAFAENRMALVIGQSNYRAVAALPNPANDAKAMSQLLSEAGFEVLSAADLTQDEIRQKIGDFAAEVAAKGPDTIALVFYAGHGLQIDGENFLVPVDVDPKREADIPLQAVRLNDILNTLTSVPSKMRIVLLDACRNNPFPAINQSAGHGLAIVDAKIGAPGTFLSFSTSRRQRTAAAPTVPIPRRCCWRPRSRGFRSKRPSNACGFRSTRRLRGVRLPGIVRR